MKTRLTLYITTQRVRQLRWQSGHFLNIFQAVQSSNTGWEGFLHKMNKRAMPQSFMTYKIAIQLHKLYNTSNPSLDWTSLNYNQILTSRQTQFLIAKSNRHKVGMNILPNRFSVLNGKIPLTWLNYSIDKFKIHIKKLLL